MRLPVILLTTLALALAGCAGNDDGDQQSTDPSGDGPGAGELHGNITVVDNSSSKETVEGSGNATYSP